MLSLSRNQDTTDTLRLQLCFGRRLVTNSASLSLSFFPRCLVQAHERQRDGVGGGDGDFGCVAGVVACVGGGGGSALYGALLSTEAGARPVAATTTTATASKSPPPPSLSECVAHTRIFGPRGG